MRVASLDDHLDNIIKDMELDEGDKWNVEQLKAWRDRWFEERENT